MNSHLWIMVLVTGLALSSLPACSPQEPAAQNETAQAQEPSEYQPIPEPPIAPADSQAAGPTVSGQLENVDLAANTITIRDSDGNEQTFGFSESTEIVGTAGVQGLSGERGNTVTIQHVEETGREMATRIEILSR